MTEVLTQRYASALEQFLEGGGEEARSHAYELGRQAVASGVDLLAIAEIHHQALERIVPPAPKRPGVELASQFLSEVLSPFEMSLRGFQETNARLVDLNASLERQNVLLAETADSERRAHEARKRAETQLIQSEKLAALGLLVAGVAHEINNPLAFVLGNMEVLGRDVRLIQELCQLYRGADAVLTEHAPELAADIAAFDARIDFRHTITGLERLLSRSVEGLDRIRQIVLDLRDFARLEEAPCKPVDINAGVELTCRIIRSKAEQKGVVLEIRSEPLPAVTCHGAKINQVILNLLVNAVDACEAGGRVGVRTRALPDGVTIEVTDTGCGIPPAIQSKIFDPFFTTKPIGVGTGLGLAISHSIVEAHRGAIEFESTPGQGTRFAVRLPFGPDPAGPS